MSTHKQRERLRRTVAELLQEPNFYLDDVARVLYAMRPRFLLAFKAEAARVRMIEAYEASMAPRQLSTFTCQACDAPFTAARRDARYCSARCRQRARRADTR